MPFTSNRFFENTSHEIINALLEVLGNYYRLLSTSHKILFTSHKIACTVLKMLNTSLLPTSFTTSLQKKIFVSVGK